MDRGNTGSRGGSRMDYISRGGSSARNSNRRNLMQNGRPEERKPDLFPRSATTGSSDLLELPRQRNHNVKSYWAEVIDRVETKVHCEAEPRIPLIDYSLVLPPKLRQRIKHIQHYDYSKSDEYIYIHDEMKEERPQDYISISDHDSEDQQPKEEALLILERRRKKVEEHFSESQHSDILRMEQEFENFNLKLDEPVGHSSRPMDTKSWLAKFVCRSRDKQPIWNSKVAKTRDDATITLDDQAENLMNASAERFVEWLNSIGSGEATMTAEKVKDFFSIKGDRTLLASIKTDPKEVNAIAQTVADKWNKPHMAIELKYEKHINDHANRSVGKPLISAFGRTVPMKDRPWVKRSTDLVIKTVYPEELLTREKIFKGITHLRSTSALIDFYLSNPELDRPKYLLQGGDFEELMYHDGASEIPLYEYLGLRY